MTILLRYVLRKFTVDAAISASAFVVIFIVVDLSNQISAYLDQAADLSSIVAYYAWSVPYFLFLTLPMSLLLGSLFCIGGLSRRNELSAMKASGVSLYRVLLPIQVFALLLSGAAWAASWSWIPMANRVRAENSAVPTSPGRQHRIQLVLRDVEGQVVSLGEYKAKERRAKRVTIDRYAEGDLVQKIRADEMVWTGTEWSLIGGERRELVSAGERVAAFDTLRATHLTLMPDDFIREARPVEQRDTEELQRLIDRKQMNGKEATRDRVELALRTAFSFSGLVMVLFGLPLSSYTRRASRPLQVGICLLISFVFYGSMQAFRAIGWNGIIDPTASVWIPNAVFLMVGGLMLKRAHT